MGMASMVLQIEKMHCGACVRRVMQALNAVPSTHAGEVGIGTARVTSDSPVENLLQALDTAGFPARVTSTEP